MVVKSATKKKLMDLGFPEYMAHTLAWNRKWDDVKILTFEEVWDELWPILFVQQFSGSEGDIVNQVKGKKILYGLIMNIKQKFVPRFVVDWWKVTLVENQNILGIGYNPFINWVKKYPIK